MYITYTFWDGQFSIQIKCIKEEFSWSIDFRIFRDGPIKEIFNCS